MTLNLASFKYRKILAKDGGPIVRLDCVPKEIRQGEFGYEARASLHEPSCTGIGSHLSKEQACYKAISEALERWAFQECLHSNQKEKYGFHLDASPSGMAAFPGLLKVEVRHLAYAEALERYAVCEWWKRELPSIRRFYKKDIEAAEINTFHSQKSTVLLWHRPFVAEEYYYGFASGESFEEAAARAEIELWRKRKVSNSSESHKFFLETLEYSRRLYTAPVAPKILVDQEIKGPWSRYATVWRCLLGKETSL